VVAHAPRIDISAQANPQNGWQKPVRREEGLSTDSAVSWNRAEAASWRARWMLATPAS